MGTSLSPSLLLAVLLSACDPGAFDPYPVGAEPRDGLDAAAPAQSELDAQLAADSSRELDGSTDFPDDPGPLDITDAGSTADAAVDPCVRLDSRVSVSKPAVELARLSSSPLFDNRVLGPMMRWGESDHVWTFSQADRVDTLGAPAATPANLPYVAFDGKFQPWNMASGPAWTLREPGTASTLPATLLPLRSGESAQLSLQPASLFRIAPEPRGHLYVVEYDVLTAKKVWLATLVDNSTVAVRAAKPLFTKPPLFSEAARVDGDFVVLYACTPASGTTPPGCLAGRVPLMQMADPGAYQVRVQDDAGVWSWSSDLTAGTPVLANVGGILSVSYNSYLRRFLAVYGEPLSNHVALRTSSAAWGPWSEPQIVPLPAPPVLSNTSIREHAPLAQSCERRIIISYLAPRTASGIFTITGDVVMTAIDLD